MIIEEEFNKPEKGKPSVKSNINYLTGRGEKLVRLENL